MNLKHTYELRNEEVIISEYDVLLPEAYEECNRDWPLVVCMVGGGGYTDIESRINSLVKKDAVILYPSIRPKPDYVIKSRHYWNFRILNEIVRSIYVGRSSSRNRG